VGYASMTKVTGQREIVACAPKANLYGVDLFGPSDCGHRRKPVIAYRGALVCSPHHSKWSCSRDRSVSDFSLSRLSLFPLHALYYRARLIAFGPNLSKYQIRRQHHRQRASAQLMSSRVAALDRTLPFTGWTVAGPAMATPFNLVAQPHGASAAAARHHREVRRSG
jgi:hypothetical protein